MRLHTFVLLASFLRCAGAQPTVTAPVLGYAYDPGLRAIRPVRGIPGAAVLGAPLEIGFVPADASIAPLQNYALAVSRNQAVSLIRWDNGSPSAASLTSTMARLGRIAFSPSGTAAILYDSVSARMQLVTGLPGTPSIQELQPAGSTAADAFAVADNGTVVLSAAGSVRSISPDLNSIPLPLPAGIVALAFDPAGANLLAATGSGDVYLAQNVTTNFFFRQVYTGDDRTSGPIAVQFSPNGAAAFVANPSGVATIDLNSGAASAIPCQCTPTGLQPFGPAGLFRITEISRRPLLLFDGTPSGNRFWFVPAEVRGSAQ